MPRAFPCHLTQRAHSCFGATVLALCPDVTVASGHMSPPPLAFLPLSRTPHPTLAHVLCTYSHVCCASSSPMSTAGADGQALRPLSAPASGMCWMLSTQLLGGGAANLCKTWVWGPFYICLQLPEVKSRDAACLVSTFWSSSVRQVSRRPWLPVCSLLCVQPGLRLVYSGCALRTWNGGSPVRAPPACLSHPRRFLSSEPCHPYHFCLCRAWHRPSFYPGALSLPSEVELRYTGAAL